MRRVTVRVQDDGDWLFRAERTDGQVLFELEYTSTGNTPAEPVREPDPSPLPEPPSLQSLLEDERYDRELDAAIKAFGRSMPDGPALSRVLEIGGFIGSMTKRLHSLTSGDRTEPVYVVDPFMPRADEFGQFCTAENMPELNRLLNQNVESIAPRRVQGSESDAAASLAPMGIDLLCVSAGLHAVDLQLLLEGWLPHLSPNGVLLARVPVGDDFARWMEWLAASPIDAAPLDGTSWFMATRKEVSP